jgi:hypothetical protein
VTTLKAHFVDNAKHIDWTTAFNVLYVKMNVWLIIVMNRIKTNLNQAVKTDECAGSSDPRTAVHDRRFVGTRRRKFVSEEAGEMDDSRRVVGHSEVWPGHIVKVLKRLIIIFPMIFADGSGFFFEKKN